MSATLSIEAKSGLDELLKYLMDNVSDDEIDDLELEKITAPSKGIAFEPVTIAAIIAASTPVALSIVRLLERYIQKTEHKENLTIIWEAGKEKDPTLIQALTSLGKTYASVEAKEGFIKVRK